MNPGRVLAVLALVASVANAAAAQTGSQTVAIEVQAINVIYVTGSPSLVVATAIVAGSAPTSVTSAAASWGVTTNQSGAKITAALDVGMPVGTMLSANLAAPPGATSNGFTPLSVTAVDVITGLTKQNAAALGLSYKLDATSAAGVVALTTRMVTYTITGGV